MSYGGQHVVNTPPYGNQETVLHSNASGNISPYYANHGGGTYQIYHPLQSISASPPPQSSAAHILPPVTTTPVSLGAGTLYSNVATNYNYGSSWHPGEYFQNAYHYQGTSAGDYVPVVGDIE